MAEEFDEDAASAPRGGTGSANPAALDAAISGPSAATDEARDFLQRQTVLTDLQSRILHEEHAFELSHLRWRRFNDQMKGDKYAPNWGQLRLKWGEALSFLGKANEAQQQFEMASHLDLSAADTASLSKWTRYHG